MKEESQIEEMRAALRGDRERAEQAARLRSTENVLETALRPSEPEPSGPEQRRGLLSRLFSR